MKIYCIFDDFDKDAIKIIEDASGDLTVHPLGVPRPDAAQMKRILEEYDCVIIGTTQKITENMFESISTPRVIATASVGLDHIKIPTEKKGLVTILNTPKANAQSVAEYTIGCALSCCKRLVEGNRLYRQGKDNKQLYRKPEDLAGKTIGVVGAGNISVRIMEYAQFFGMVVLCWTRNPDHHSALEETSVRFIELEELVEKADVISVNLPNNAGTRGLISEDLIRKMKDTATFISVSRLDIIDVNALFDKAKRHSGFYVCLDLDVNQDVVKKMPVLPNVMVTPHIAGGTIETRKRMFREVAEQVAAMLRKDA
jgi:phosphoglycerate dehydrogenase-like enzyme